MYLSCPLSLDQLFYFLILEPSDFPCLCISPVCIPGGVLWASPRPLRLWGASGAADGQVRGADHRTAQRDSRAAQESGAAPDQRHQVRGAWCPRYLSLQLPYPSAPVSPISLAFSVSLCLLVCLWVYPCLVRRLSIFVSVLSWWNDQRLNLTSCLPWCGHWNYNP